MRPLNDKKFQELFRRQDALYQHQPKCPHCGTDQIQIMDWGVPAQWKCRMCRTRFASEPGVAITAGD